MKKFGVLRIFAFGLLAGLVPPGGAQAQAPRVGDVAPDFTLERLEGGEISLSDFSGRVVFINFFGYG